MPESQASGGGAAARSEPAGFAVGLGLTNECDLHCAHCYRDSDRVDRLSLDEVRRVCRSLPIRAVNLGTGENALHPEFRAIVRELHQHGVTLTLTSNGYSIRALPDEELRWLRDVELSLDFATEAEQDAWRGAGNWRLVQEQLARCRRLGIGATVTAVMMRSNYERLPALAAVASEHGAGLRINVYQPVKTDAFTLSYEQFWTGFRLLLDSRPLLACSEPIVCAALGLSRGSSGCGATTVRVSPSGQVLPCVYWPKRKLTLADLERLGAGVAGSPEFNELKIVPDVCRSCELVEICGGGCASRRLRRGGLHLADEFCPLLRGEQWPVRRRPRPAGREFPKVNSACTSIFGARASSGARG
ncbi:MAG: radical SAM protein [Deltaproteobacteria bacterium]|nr:radical SAM protein [Deltaproteobacteria bacterium]